MTSLRVSMAASMVALLAACSSSQGTTGKVSVLLTDATADLAKAVVTITEIDIVGADGKTALVTDQKITRDLLLLANNPDNVADGIIVPAGTYSQLRFVISGGYIQLKGTDGNPGAIYASSPSYEGLPEGATVAGGLQMPSYAQSGLKIDLPGGAVQIGTEAVVLLVDIDVGQSFAHEAGNSGKWVMHPVCTATKLEFSGTINVTLKLADGVTLPTPTTLGDFNAVLTMPGGTTKPPLQLVPTSAPGVYGASFTYLVPGTYGVSFSAPTSFTTTPPSSPSPAPVAVVSGQATTASFTVTGVTPPAQ